MGQQWILLVILTLYEVGFTTETENGEKINDSLWLYHDTLTWDQAFDFCKNIDASLAVPEPEEDIAVRTAFKNNDPVWVGQYTYTTPWLYPSGCFSSNNPNYTRIEENNVSTCKRFCGDSDIMVNIYNCLCVEKAPDINDRKPLGLCNTRCPSNRKEYCGGQGVFQHYATYTDIESTEDDNDHCGMAEKKTSIDIVVRDCTMENAFLCAVHDNDSGDRPFYVSKYNNGSIRFLPFQDALENCVKNGSYLVDPTKLDPTQFQSGEPIQYWVGVRRNVSYVRSVQELPINVRNQQCLYMTKGSADVTPRRTRDCSRRESFLCRKQVEPTTAIISRSESTSAATTASILNRTLPIDITADQGNQETPATGTGSSYFITPQPMTAFEAYDACIEKNSMLAVPKTDAEFLALNLTETGDLGVWTGEYVDDVAPWVYARGCWGAVEGAMNHTENSGSLCLQKCGRDIDSVLVREAQCKCNFNVDGKEAVYSLCNKVCNGDGGTCGGQISYFTQYIRCGEKTCPVEFNVDIEQNCVYIDLKGKMKAAPCEEEHFPVCVMGKGNDATIELFVNATDGLKEMSWSSSNKFCQENGGVLADVTEIAGSLKSRAKQLKKSEPTFWMALNRAITPTKSIRNSSLSNSSQCFYITRPGKRSMYKNCEEKAFPFCRKKLDSTDRTNSHTKDSSSEDNTSRVQVTGFSIGVVTAVVLTAAVAVAAMTVYFRKLRQKRVRIQIETPPEEACSNEDEDRYEIPYPANHEYIELSSGKDYDEMSSYERLQDPDTSENPYRQINLGEEAAQGPPLLGHYESLDIGTRSDNSMYTSLT